MTATFMAMTSLFGGNFSCSRGSQGELSRLVASPSSSQVRCVKPVERKCPISDDLSSRCIWAFIADLKLKRNPDCDIAT